MLPRLLLALFLLATLLAAAAWLHVQAAVRGELERAVARATGSEFIVGAVRPLPSGDGLLLTDLRLAGPPGFSGRALLRIDRIRLRVRPRSVIAGVLELRSVEIEGALLHLHQRRGHSNLAVMLDRMEMGGGAAPGDLRPVTIASLRLSASMLETDLGPAWGRAGQRRLSLPDLALHFDPGQTGPASSDAWVTVVAVHLVEHAIARTRHELPADILDPLARRMDQLLKAGTDLPFRRDDRSGTGR